MPGDDCLYFRYADLRLVLGAAANTAGAAEPAITVVRRQRCLGQPWRAPAGRRESTFRKRRKPSRTARIRGLAPESLYALTFARSRSPHLGLGGDLSHQSLRLAHDRR